MQFLENLKLKPSIILKALGLFLVGIIVLSLSIALIGGTFRTLGGSSALQGLSKSSVSMEGAYYDSYDMDYGASNNTLMLSARNVINSEMEEVMPTNDDVVMGTTAEDFEIKEYNAYLETRQLEDTCSKIADLKAREDVIFENANEYEKSCNYNFKVKQESVEEVLAIIEELDPKELNESIYTIKRMVDDYTSEIEILETKMQSIEETLNNAITSYDDITNLATKTQDVESLAKIIESKLRIIERLTQERININAQLERLNRSKAEQLDRLEYTYFNVRITEDKFIDGENLKDSWKSSVKYFVRDVNKVAQDITINLVLLLFIILQYVIYLFVILIVVKYIWKFAKGLWKK